MATGEARVDDAIRVEREWLAAGKAGDVERMRELRERYPQWLDLGRTATTGSTSLNATGCDWNGFFLDSIGASALHAAAWDGNVEIARFLIEAGQHPDTPDDSGMTPAMIVIVQLSFTFMRSVSRGRDFIPYNLVLDSRDEDTKMIEDALAFIELCHRFGGDLDARSTDGTTLLGLATFDNAFAVAKYLLDAGASIDVPDNRGQIALHHAINYKSLLVTNLLLERGASIDLCDANGMSPLSLVVKRDLALQLQLILNHYELVSTASRQDFSVSVLFDAVDADAREIVSFMLKDKYASLSSRNSIRETPMHRAILSRRLGMIRLLYEFDDDGEILAARTLSGDSCLHYAALHGRFNVTAFILDKYCSGTESGKRLLSCLNNRGETPLLVAGMEPYGHEIDPEQSAKIAALVETGAPLFPPGYPKWRLSKTHDRVLLPLSVCRCLCLWVAVNPVPQMCYDWAASVDWSSIQQQQQQQKQQQTQRPLSSAVVVTMLETGFVLEAAQLLALLPLQRAAVDSRFLPALRIFLAGDKSHALLLQMGDTLTESWRRSCKKKDESATADGEAPMP